MSDKLSLQNISFCYRISLACHILEIELENYRKFYAALPNDVNLYESPQTTLSTVHVVNTKNLGLEINRASRFILDFYKRYSFSVSCYGAAVYAVVGEEDILERAMDRRGCYKAIG